MADEGFEEDMGSAEEGNPEVATMIDEDELLEEDESKAAEVAEVSVVAMMRNNYVEDLEILQRSWRPMETGSAAETGERFLRCSCFVSGDRRPRRDTDQFCASRH